MFSKETTQLAHSPATYESACSIYNFDNMKYYKTLNLCHWQGEKWSFDVILICNPIILNEFDHFHMFKLSFPFFELLISLPSFLLRFCYFLIDLQEFFYILGKLPFVIWVTKFFPDYGFSFDFTCGIIHAKIYLRVRKFFPTFLP